MTLRRRPFVLVISAPSGAGKTTLARRLVQQHEEIVFSTSATTRAPRAKERPGTDYLFVDDAEFDRMLSAGDLVEWAVVHGRKYGTPRTAISDALAQGRVVALDIDVQGARQIRAKFPDAVLVFVLPPSAEELVKRLTGRGSEPESVLRSRLENARPEIPEVREFDYVIVNDDLERAYAALEAIVVAEMQRVARVESLDAAVQRFDREIEQFLEGSS